MIDPETKEAWKSLYRLAKRRPMVAAHVRRLGSNLLLLDGRREDVRLRQIVSAQYAKLADLLSQH